MPRIRTVKPEFWSHPVMGRASDGAKCLALALLNLADDEGFFQASAALVRNFARPFDPDPGITDSYMIELCAKEWIEIREHPTYGKLGRVAKFRKHQVVNRPKRSELRPYFEEVEPAHGSITHESVTNPSGKGREGKGKEESSHARTREAKQDPGAVSEPWPAAVLEKLRTALGRTALEANDQPWMGFVARSMHHPVAARVAGAEKYIAENHRPGEHHPGYVLKIIEREASAVSQPVPSGSRDLPPSDEVARTEELLRSLRRPKNPPPWTRNGAKT